MNRKAEPSTHKTTDQAAQKAHEVVDAAADRAGHAEERIRETTEHARERSRDMVSKVSKYVDENPLTALGIAFAAGTIFSAIIRRR